MGTTFDMIVCFGFRCSFSSVRVGMIAFDGRDTITTSALFMAVLFSTPWKLP